MFCVSVCICFRIAWTRLSALCTHQSQLFLFFILTVVVFCVCQTTRAEPWNREGRWTRGVAIRTPCTRDWDCCCRGTAVPDRSPRTFLWPASIRSPYRATGVRCPRSPGPRRPNTRPSKNSRRTASGLWCPCRDTATVRPALWPEDILSRVSRVFTVPKTLLFLRYSLTIKKKKTV